MTPNHIKHATAAAAVVLAAACAGTPFSWEDTARVHSGMTEAEVIAILGQPYSRNQINGQTTALVWVFATAFGPPRSIAYRVVDGRVVASAAAGR